MTVAERCVDPECGVVLVTRRPGLKAADLPPGHRLHYGRNLCQTSFKRIRRRGELHKYPRASWRVDEVLDRWQALRQPPFDYSIAQIAGAVGMTPKALSVALDRARKAGDPRAVPGRVTRFQSRQSSFREGGARGWARWDLFDTGTVDEGEETA